MGPFTLLLRAIMQGSAWRETTGTKKRFSPTYRFNPGPPKGHCCNPLGFFKIIFFRETKGRKWLHAKSFTPFKRFYKNESKFGDADWVRAALKVRAVGEGW